MWTRRRFLVSSAAASIALSISRLTVAAESFKGHETMPIAPGWSGKGSGQPQYRIDGYAKVTGAKLYPRDFRASDMPGWPSQTSHAMLIFSNDATRVFSGLDLATIDDDLKPDRIVSNADLVNADIRATGFFECDLFCPEGTTPAYLGQPVALFIYADFDTFNAVRSILPGTHGLVTYGAETGPIKAQPYGANRFTRVAGAGPDDSDVYSPLQHGWVVPIRYRKGGQALWAAPERDGNAAQQASAYGKQIRNDLANGRSGQLFTQSFQTQSTDQFFMEPENGLAWHDTTENRLALVIGSQSPEITLEGLAGMLSKAKSPHAPGEIDGYFPFLGGGFGGKDRPMLPLYVAVAGLFNEGRPVRLALNRFEQFQLGLKRHAIKIDTQLGVDPETGQFQAFACDLSLDGGGLANYSATVADVSAASTPSIYYLPKSDITTVANHSRAVTAGSMRGFGALQSLTSTEVLVDEVATSLKIDPIEIRRRNALQSEQLNFAGNTASGALRTNEMLDAIERSDIWTKRKENRKAFEADNSGKAYGVGLSCVIYQYGSGADGALGSVTIDPNGKITATANSVEMGTGTTTAIAVRAADHLGHFADEVRLEPRGPYWAPLQLVTSGDAWSISQKDQDRLSKNPRWVPAISADAGASTAAHITTQMTAEATDVILRFGLWPAALAIWSAGPFGGAALGADLTFEDLRWVNGSLAGAGMEPLPLARLAKKAHEMGLVTGAMVHGFNRWSWAKAKFQIGADTFEGPIDALAVQRAGRNWEVLDRISINYPPAVLERMRVNYYSGCAVVTALSVDKTNGQVQILDVHQVVDCGRPVVPELVTGMSQGGLVQGIGHALHEYLPLYEDGPGNGTWNVNRYRVPRASDVPIWNTTIETLPVLSETDPPKGIGEIGIIPIVPATLNAIRDAIGVRFTKTPVTPGDIMEAL